METNNVIIYGKTGCPYCEKAIKWFNDNAIKYEYKILDDIDQRKALYLNLSKTYNTNVETVPQIFIGSEYIGGYSNLINKQDLVKELYNIKNVNINVDF